MQSSLTCQFEHSGKVRSGLIGNFLFPLLSGSASFSLCCADEFKKNETACCPQIEDNYYNLYLHAHFEVSVQI